MELCDVVYARRVESHEYTCRIVEEMLIFFKINFAVGSKVGKKKNPITMILIFKSFERPMKINDFRVWCTVVLQYKGLAYKKPPKKQTVKSP